MKFDSKVIVIVGAGPGLGACLSASFTGRGGQVVLVARSARSLAASSEAARQAGGNPITVEADVLSVSSTRQMAEAVIAEYGKIDVLVNNAFGAPRRRNLLDMDEQDLSEWRKTAEIGGYGTLLACRFTVPHMVKAGRGSVVNITSLSSRTGMPGRSDYAAGKAQAHKLAQSFAAELGPLGVRVNCVAPGPIWSQQLENFYRAESEQLGTPYEEVLARHAGATALGRVPTEQEISNAVLFLASDLSSGITGAVLDVNAGLYCTP
jgi:NAD(P)-dependent dehydrogenase (short-subunit alcohol dehydrogenase family)